MQLFIKGADNPLYNINQTKKKDKILFVKPKETRKQIDWDCPCLAGERKKPCFPQLKAALSCDLKENESECRKLFLEMTDCMKQYPDLYPMDPPKE